MCLSALTALLPQKDTKGYKNIVLIRHFFIYYAIARQPIEFSSVHFVTIYGLFNNKRRMVVEKSILRYSKGTLCEISKVLNGSLDIDFDTYELFP